MKIKKCMEKKKKWRNQYNPTDGQQMMKTND